MEVPSQVINDLKLANLQNAYSDLKYYLEEEIYNHRESQNLIKLLEDKLEETEAKFISESNKVKVEKEMFETKIKVLEDSSKAFKDNTKTPEVMAETPDDPTAKFGKSEENSNELNESDEPQDLLCSKHST